MSPVVFMSELLCEPLADFRFMPFRACEPSDALFVPHDRAREGLADIRFILERCRQRYIVSRLYTSESPENVFLFISIVRNFPKHILYM
ncbi:hypothetical protein T235_17270 [Tannerella sp. oral taxon BU063 isolate Cell 8/11]|uniref:Uncharacterized protein n=1 Tax=Tannerella sp. oral taxon BU063 isolate Cell 8/11 TaxID=1411915 RepID=W2CVF4_9BACT|nr:hypothetical protein T235_17270 [Tannerella sp. oral taxon BU063 isolate Cell 8/11]